MSLLTTTYVGFRVGIAFVARAIFAASVVSVLLIESQVIGDDAGFNRTELPDSDVDSTSDVVLPIAMDSEGEAAPSPLAELEQLLAQPVVVPALEQEVTTVTGQQSTVGRSAAAVFVVTQEMIRRSGATCIPDLLRMVPGLQVARVNSDQWAITARGFDTNLAGLFATNNKLLVLIDGRTVYTPFFAGVYWDIQDVVLDDVERIEVIRGPGATIWGANAVNGVISIITKRASDTQGGLLKAGGGKEEKGFATARIGGDSGNVQYRAYGKWFDRDEAFSTTGRDVDDWRQGRGGFRMDWTPESSYMDTITFQGDYYTGKSGFYNGRLPGGDDELVRGGNVLGRWVRTFSDDSDLSLQMYYSRDDRTNSIGILNQQIGTGDIDLRHSFRLGWRHQIIWGVGYRSVSDELNPTTAPPVLFFDPSQRTYDTFSAFLQDEYAVIDEELFFTLGAKILNNDFTDFEVQPSARLLWSPDPSWAAWGAVSRAVRTPSRVEHDLRIPLAGPLLLAFSSNFQSEELLAYELGFRQQPEPWFSWDMALFYHQYENLESFRFAFPIISNANDNRGEGYGVELSSQVEVTPYWRLSGWYSFLQLQIHPGPLSLQSGTEIEGASPHNQAFLMSSHDLTDNVDFDLIGRYVDNLPSQAVHRYISLDVRLAWRPSCCSELSIVGQNLLDPHHPEFGGTSATQVQRGVYGMITRTW